VRRERCSIAVKHKKSGRVSLIFEQGDISSVQTFQRLLPGRKFR
jgi:hypothetical protein